MLALLLGPAPAASTPSSTELVARAAGAFSRWAAAGFGRVDAEAYEQRRAACNGCEHLTTPSTRLVRLMAGGAANTKVACGLCGCDVRKKAWLLTESRSDGRWPQADG